MGGCQCEGIVLILDDRHVEYFAAACFHRFHELKFMVQSTISKSLSLLDGCYTIG